MKQIDLLPPSIKELQFRRFLKNGRWLISNIDMLLVIMFSKSRSFSSDCLPTRQKIEMWKNGIGNTLPVTNFARHADHSANVVFMPLKPGTLTWILLPL